MRVGTLPPPSQERPRAGRRSRDRIRLKRRDVISSQDTVTINATNAAPNVIEAEVKIKPETITLEEGEDREMEIVMKKKKTSKRIIKAPVC